MAAVQNRQHSNILAITPDARPCDALLPAATTTTSSSSTTTNNNKEALAQYLQYRSAPSLYPSYDRLRFVRLPSNYLPSLLRQNHNNNNDDNDSYSSLQYWPAIIYENYAELVRDLGKAASAKTKAKFSVRHRKFGSNAVVVARLLMWDDSLVGAPTCSSEGPPPATAAVSGNSSSEGGGGGSDSSKKSSSKTCLFPEPTIHIVQLDSSLTQLESNNSSTRLVSFYDAQFDLEECCTNLLRRYSPSSTANKKSGGGEEERRRVYNYALQFQKAVDMALNCLALDVGGDVLHDRVMGEEGTTTTTTPGGGGGGVASNTATTAAAAVKNETEAAKKKKRQVVVEKRVQNLEIAIPPTTNANATTTTNAITTKPKAAGPNETMKQPQDVLSRKESTTRTESKRGGGGGGTKSKRPEASQPIPKKFQSTSKATTTTTTASISTTTKDVTTTTTTMNQTNNHPIPPWKDVWKIMRSNGWTWKGSTGLSTGYRYIKPNCKIKNGTENIDYFNSEQDVQSFARNVYGWGIRDHTYQSLSEVIQDHAKYVGEYVPPLPPMTSIGPKEPWRDVWDKMRLCGGWTWKTGSGLMMDYYYIKPNGTIKGGIKGQDYFETVEEVQLFAKRNYGWVGEEEEVLENDGGSEQHRPALMDLNENTLPEKKRRRTEKVSMDNKPAVKKVKSLKSKMEMKPINEEEEEVMEEEEEEEEEEFEEEMASSGENDDANDDDDTSRFSEARSTYSQSGFQSKKLFINECADEYVPSLEGEQIHPDDPWNVVWKTMRKTGWSWKAGSGLMMDYYYIKPGCNVKDGEEGKDYFVSEEDVQRFAERNYGWNRGVVCSDNVDSRGKGRKRSLSTSSSDGSHFSEANDDCAADEIKKTKKKKKTTKKIQMSPNQEQNDHASSAPLRLDPYTWKTLWPALQKDGWKVIKAGKYNRLHDWYYVRPDCDPGDGSSELHIDYFLSEEDVCGFARQTNYFDGCEESEPVHEEYAEQAQTEHAPKRVKSSSKHPSTPEGCKTQPQDPAKPLLSSAESCSSQFSSSSNDYYDWNNLWPVLQTGGWRVIKASNPLHDWYYVRPNRDPKDPTTKLGRHYFTCPDEVIDFVKRLDEKDGKQSRKSDIGGMLKAFEEEATVYSGSQL